MFVQGDIQQAAIQVISSSFVTNGITGVTICSGLDASPITYENYPLVEVICSTWRPVHKELNLGVGRAILTVVVSGIKSQMSSSLFETIADAAIEPFFTNNIVATMNGYATDTFTQALYEADNGLDVFTLQDGWCAKQELELVITKTS